ncbi:MFS amine transporter [Aspergillus steynii IBT 23096]|uniref:MFS amine transporter n=1 Tax=Aspergillus steynii IBT 23096 TaxID=1392250 RepID=A0A2I2GEA3_9EURO|nr:MFS amine transporter [Aspergillus steynii IBT 23096]PLB51161.1 MFS amine transporter [Aspergillus steynii IBT 23096]
MHADGLHDAKGPVSEPPWNLEFRSSKRFVISVVSIAVFTDVFIYGMIVPILPVVLQTRVIVPDDELQKWMSILLAAFGGALFVGSPIFGYFADKSTSRQGPFIIGLAALGGSTVMFWIASTLTALVIARALQGLSAAVVWTVGMALVVDTVGKDQVGAAMGYVSMAMTVGTVFGPFIGGIMLSRLGYHAVFVMAIGLVVLDILLRLFMIEQKTASKWAQPGVNETESLLDAAPGDGIHYGTARSVSSDQSSEDCTQLLVDNIGESASSGRVSSMPVMVRLICSRRVLVALGATVVEAMMYSSFDTVLPLYVMRTFKWGPMLIGFCFLPLFAPSFSSPQVGAAVDRCGPRLIAFLGFSLGCPVFLLLRLITENTAHDQILLYIFLFIAGIATTMQMVALMTEVDHFVEGEEKAHPGIFGKQGAMAQAYGLFNVAWSGGQVLGPLVAGLLMDLGGWSTMTCAFGVMSAATAIVIALTDRTILQALGLVDNQ